MVPIEDLVTPRMKRGMDRMVAALTGQSDRVPVMAQLAAHTLRLTGVEDRDFWSDPDVFLRSHLMASEYYRLDSPSTYFDVYNVEAEALGQPLVWLPGEFPEIDRTKHLLRDPDILDRLRPPGSFYGWPYAVCNKYIPAITRYRYKRRFSLLRRIQLGR